MPYTANRPPPRRTSEELRASIPGWGADLDPANRPAVPRERFDPSATGAHWELPVGQVEREPRERSLEHTMLPPVFGTSVPLRGLSGAIRRLAYRRYSEGRTAHWLLLVLGDRVDAVESHARSLATAHPDNPFTQTGIRAELTHGGLRSRFGRRRADVKHQWLDPLVIVGPWVLAGAALAMGVRAAVKLLSR